MDNIPKNKSDLKKELIKPGAIKPGTVKKVDRSNLMVDPTKLGNVTRKKISSGYAPNAIVEDQPIYVDKRMAYAIAGAVLLFFLGIVIWKVASAPSALPQDRELLLAAGANIKKNISGTTWATLSVPSKIAKNELLKTSLNDRRNVIVLADGSTLRFDYNTSFKVRKATSEGNLHKYLISLIKGTMFVDEKLDSNVVIETKYARVTPVGTRFAVSQKELKNLTEQTTVQVIEGTVEVEHIDDPSSKTVVTVGNEVAVASQSISSPTKASKDDWIGWNATWSDAEKIPTAEEMMAVLNKDKVVKPQAPVNQPQQPNSQVFQQSQPSQPQPSQPQPSQPRALPRPTQNVQPRPRPSQQNFSDNHNDNRGSLTPEDRVKVLKKAPPKVGVAPPAPPPPEEDPNNPNNPFYNPTGEGVTSRSRGNALPPPVRHTPLPPPGYVDGGPNPNAVDIRDKNGYPMMPVGEAKDMDAVIGDGSGIGL